MTRKHDTPVYSALAARRGGTGQPALPTAYLRLTAPEPEAIRLTLPYPPSTNHLFATYHGRRLLSSEGRRYKLEVARIALAAGVRPLSGDVTLTLFVYRPRRSGDLSNRIKVLEDGL